MGRAHRAVGGPVRSLRCSCWPPRYTDRSRSGSASPWPRRRGDWCSLRAGGSWGWFARHERGLAMGIRQSAQAARGTHRGGARRPPCTPPAPLSRSSSLAVLPAVGRPGGGTRARPGAAAAAGIAARIAARRAVGIAVPPARAVAHSRRQRAACGAAVHGRDVRPRVPDRRAGLDRADAWPAGHRPVVRSGVSPRGGLLVGPRGQPDAADADPGRRHRGGDARARRLRGRRIRGRGPGPARLQRALVSTNGLAFTAVAEYAGRPGPAVRSA